MTLTDEDILEILKVDLQVSSSALDLYLLVLIASARAFWKLEVSLSIRMGLLPRHVERPAAPAILVQMRLRWRDSSPVGAAIQPPPGQSRNRARCAGVGR